jgi:Mn2+/Fe2+ NRAMP family transporter
LVQGVVLPLELVLMLIIINRPRVMGAFRNNLTSNIVAWTTVAVVGTLAITFTIQQLRGGP